MPEITASTPIALNFFANAASASFSSPPCELPNSRQLIIRRCFRKIILSLIFAGSLAEFWALHTMETEKWAKVVKASGAKIQ